MHFESILLSLLFVQVLVLNACYPHLIQIGLTIQLGAIAFIRFNPFCCPLKKTLTTYGNLFITSLCFRSHSVYGFEGT